MHRPALLLVAFVPTVALAACAGSAGGGGGSGGVSSSAVHGALGVGQLAPAAGPASDTAGGASTPAEKQAGASAGGSETTSPPLDIGRPQGRIERRVDAAYTVPHGAFLRAFDAVIARATQLGGFVVGSATQPDADGRIASGSVTVRVPAEHLSELVSGMPGDFHVSSINYSSTDHTAEAVDLTARLQAAKAQRDALLQLLSRTTSVTDIAALRDQIAKVQLTIDQVQGQSDAVAAAVDLATARVGLVEQGLKSAPPAPSGSTLVDALRSGLANADAVLAAALLGTTSALPVLAVAALLGAGWWVARRRPRVTA